MINNFYFYNNFISLGGGIGSGPKWDKIMDQASSEHKGPDSVPLMEDEESIIPQIAH